MLIIVSTKQPYECNQAVKRCKMYVFLTFLIKKIILAFLVKNLDNSFSNQDLKYLSYTLKLWK